MGDHRRSRSQSVDMSENSPLLDNAGARRATIPRRQSLWRAISQESIFFTYMDKNSKAQNWSEVSRQGSVVTIFAIWNTMMGTSLLAMPWGIERAGIIMGPVMMLTLGGICLYTAYCNIRAHSQYGGPTGDISELTKALLGPKFEILAKIFSFIVLLGANIVYWILMTNFLFHSVNYLTNMTEGVIYDNAGNFSISHAGVVCPLHAVPKNTTEQPVSLFSTIWDIDTTVPIFLVLIIAPLLNFKSPTFFTKFNSLGTLSVMYLVLFVLIKFGFWGVNIDLSDTQSIHYSPMIRPSFLATSGMLALSYFIHNIIITVLRSNADQKNNGRDLSIAYVLVTVTYASIGILFYVSFPLEKACIQDNVLNNFASWDIMTAIARIFLLFQLVTVFPLISYMLRAQVMVALTGDPFPGRGHVLIFNSVVVLICVLFAIFLPRIGTIIRFTGALSGLVHVFTLPCLLRLACQYKTGKISLFSWFVHLVIPIFGAANLLGQFFVSDFD